MPDAETEFDVTLLENIDATRVDGVENPANGTGWILMKAMSASGALNEKPDIAGAEKILMLLADLIASEAQELKAGRWDETCDISLLTEAAGLVKMFRRGEQMAAEAEAASLTKDLEEAIAGFALSLAKDNPLSDDKTNETSGADGQPVEPEAVEPEVQKEVNDAPDVSEIVKSAVAEAMSAHEAAATELRDEIAKLRATPIPGGPFITNPSAAKTTSNGIAKAVELERKANLPDLDRDLASFYRAEAKRLRGAAE